MAKAFISAPVQYPASLIKSASELNKKVGYEYKPNKEGAELERQVFSLLQLLEAEEVFFPPSKVIKETLYLSYLDTDLKVDICLKVNNFYLCWQIKAGMEEAKKHLALEKVTFKDKSYPVPGLIVIATWEKGKIGWKLEVLSKIAQVSGVPIRQEVITGIEKWKKLHEKLKGKLLPSSVFSPQESVWLTTLGLIQVQGTNVKII